MKDSKTPILVYASEKAMIEPVRPLPEALEVCTHPSRHIQHTNNSQKFVQADNAKFKEEFSDSHEVQDSQGSVSSPKSPGKRKWEQDTPDSQETVLPRYQDQPRWGGMSSSRNDEKSSFGHFEHVEPKSTWESMENNPDVIMGQDPNDLIDISVPDEEIARMDSQKSIPHEMHVKKGLTSLLPSAMEDARPSTEMDIEPSQPEVQDLSKPNGDWTHSKA